MTTKRLERAFGVLVVLHENVVPDFDVLTAVTTGTAVGTALLLAGVDEHFGIRTAGTGRTGRTPPVIFAREAIDALVGNTERLPNFNGLLVSRNVTRLTFNTLTLKYGYRKLIGRKAELRRKELVTPADRLLLEVIVERPVAEHFKKRKVGGVTDRIDIARTDTLLNVGKARSSGMLHRAHQIRHQRVHTGSRKKNGRIILRNNRSAGNYFMTLGFEKLKIHFAEFVRSKILHI